MIDGYSRVLTVVAAVGAGVNAGVFFAFSTFVMRALGRLPAPQAVSAMQAINRQAPTAWFMTVLFGTAATCAVTAVVGVARWSEPWGVLLVIGGGLFLVSIVVTIVSHVPRNNGLDGVDADGPAAADAWQRYLGAWKAWNHVRTLTCMASGVVLVVALGMT